MTRCCVAHFPSLDKLTSGFQVHLNICTTVTAGMPAMDKRRQRLRCGGRLLLFHCVLAVISPAKAREVTSDPMFRPFNSIDRARACDSAGSFADAAYCNMSLSIDERMEDLLVRLTQEEKVRMAGLVHIFHLKGLKGKEFKHVYCDFSLDHLSPLGTRHQISLLVNAAPGIPHQALPAYEWWSEALHGVGLSPGVTFAPPTPTATSFPQVVTTSQSFNPALMQAIGASISTEGRAFNNVGHAGNTYWAPNINVFRDPRWGRGQETPGEDPFLSGVYAASFVRGMQEGEDPRYLKTSACCKHFAAYSVENLYNGTHRHNFDARVTPQDMADTYLPAFEACVKEGRASALMCSYNAINGVPACADAELLNALARGSWGFDGYITSDCGAIADIWTRHNYTNTPEEACQVALEAGCDLDCSTFYQEHCPHALSQGLVTDADVDTALSHLFRVQFRLGMFDAEEGQIYTKYGLERLNTPEHQELALEAARQGIVLLKNQGPVLPLPRPGLTNEQGGEHLPAAPLGADAWTSTFLRHHRRVEAPPEGPLPARESVSLVAVVGPHANGTQALLGNYRGIPPYIVSPIEGIRAYVPDALFAPGCGINSSSEQAFADAESAVSSAHVTVLILGLDVSIEDEGKDRTSLELPAPQVELAGRVLDAAVGRPVVVVLVGGGAVDVDFLARDDRVAAMLFAGYPGRNLTRCEACEGGVRGGRVRSVRDIEGLRSCL